MHHVFVFELIIGNEKNQPPLPTQSKCQVEGKIENTNLLNLFIKGKYSLYDKACFADGYTKGS